MSELLGCGSVFWQAHTASLDGEVVWRREEVEAGVVVVKNPDGRTELLAHGDPERLALVLECARGEGIEQPTSAMLTRGTPLSEELRAWLPPYWGNEWDFYWTRQPLAPHEGDALVRRIDAEEARELDSHPIVTFGMWAENPARRLYDSLGYVHGGGQIIADSAPFGPH